MQGSKMDKGVKVLTLRNYIIEHHSGVQTKFAKANNIDPPQVTQWINGQFLVIDNVLYSKRRVLAGGRT